MSGEDGGILKRGKQWVPGEHKVRVLTLVLEVKEALPEEGTFQVRLEDGVGCGQELEGVRI